MVTRSQLKMSILASVFFLLHSPAFAEAKSKTAATSSQSAMPWMNTALSADKRTELLLQEMTQDEKLQLVFGYFGTDFPPRKFIRPPESIAQSAGYVKGIPRLHIPEQFQTDAGMGVASQQGPAPRERTALPSGLNTAASWDPNIAYQGGAMIGAEARASGFNVMLAGGANLIREPRNGRNFEYAGEDPLLAGRMAGHHIKGVQSNHIISTLKHFAMNSQETGRMGVNAIIDDASARMSDLLAMQIANEVGNPGSVMCAYNRMNGFYACENNYLLNEVLKTDWGFKGYVMSDWGATHSTIPAANNGLDQESGAEAFDESPYFAGALKEAVANKWVAQTRLDDMVKRILWAMFDKGVIDNPVSQNGTIDFKSNGLVSQTAAEQGMVLLKNKDNFLPLSKSLKKIAVIGGHADAGVLSGGGSSKVYPVGGLAVKGLLPEYWPGPVIYFPSSPLNALKNLAPETQFTYNDGTDLKSVKKLAAESDAVLVFANQWLGESFDATSLALPDNQDALINGVAAANKKTLVVLQTGGPVSMPWLNAVNSVVAAWYPGTNGGQAIARVLYGEVNPSGHLPVTFPASEKQLPRIKVDGDPKQEKQHFDVHYTEGATVGYKWFDAKKYVPLFAFGYGLSYTEFAYAHLTTDVKNEKVTVSFRVKNIGRVAGKDVPQVYISPKNALWESPKRLAAWDKVDLNPDEIKTVTVELEPRILGVFDSPTKTWKIAEGDYTLQVGMHAMDDKAITTNIHLNAMTLDVNGKVIR